MAPLFVVTFYFVDSGSHILSTVLFVIASFTDWLDGYTARSYNLVTRLGEFLDPVADKVLVVTVLIILLNEYHTLYLSLPALILIIREISVSSLREWLASSDSKILIPSSLSAKYKTACQMLALSFLIFNASVQEGTVWILGLTLLYISAGLSLFSFI
mgnify:CR=1 FL=1